MPGDDRHFRRIRVIDTHTGGEPTRVVVTGGPDLGGRSLAARRERFRAQFDEFRSTVVNEPRGSDVLVGALLCRPVDENLPNASTMRIVMFARDWNDWCLFGCPAWRPLPAIQQKPRGIEAVFVFRCWDFSSASGVTI